MSTLTQQQFAFRANFVSVSIMTDTPNASRALTAAVFAHNWDQTALAKATGLHNSVVSLHLSGKRAIRDDHLAAYCGALSSTEQAQLVAAWLRDTLPSSAQSAVLSENSDSVQEEVAAWRPGLDEEQRQMLAWWAQKLATDRELDEVFRIVTRRAGWQSNSTEKPTF